MYIKENILTFFNMSTQNNTTNADVKTNAKIVVKKRVVQKKKETTFVMIKPDGVRRGLVGKILTMFEEKGFELKCMAMIQPNPTIVREHYADFVDRDFFPRILKFMTSGRVACFQFSGYDAVAHARALVGATNPQDANPNTVRGKYAHCIEENVIHASDSVKNANREIDLWFRLCGEEYLL